jgi:hypothetical protein
MGDFRMQLLGTKGQRLVGKLDYGLWVLMKPGWSTFVLKIKS